MSRMRWSELLDILREKDIQALPLPDAFEGGTMRVEVFVERGPAGYRRYRVVAGHREVCSREFGDNADLTDQIAAIVSEAIKSAAGPGGLPRAN